MSRINACFKNQCMLDYKKIDEPEKYIWILALFYGKEYEMI